MGAQGGIFLLQPFILLFVSLLVSMSPLLLFVLFLGAGADTDGILGDVLHQSSLDQFLNVFDKNHDGRLELAELLAPHEIAGGDLHVRGTTEAFVKADLGKLGYITKNELDSFLRFLFSYAQEGLGQSFTDSV